ncbi:MAG: YgeY family selenium metabolism-linked hydrolase [Caldilineales bacterium]
MPYLNPQDQAACIEFLRDLIRIRSYSGEEGALAARVAAEMKQLGFEQVYQDRAGSVIGRVGKGTQRLLFNGHMDTVGIGNPATWSDDPFSGALRGGMVYGRGAVDMKSGLAAVIYSVKALLDNDLPLRGELVVAAVVQEEPAEGVAMRVLVEEEGLWPSFVVLAEPTALDIALGHRGRVELLVAVEGRACHGSAPELGENALVAASKVIFGVELLAQQLAEDARLGKGSIAVTGLHCPSSSRNMVPDHCELIIDRRLTLGETSERAVHEVQQILEREGVRGEVKIAPRETRTYTGYLSRGQEYYPPWLMPDDSPLVKAALRGAERALEHRPRLRLWSFSTDGAYTRGEAGIPTIGFGPGDDRLAHTANEQVAVSDVLLAVEGYAQIALELVGKR